jgi:hypothetical protein
MTKVVLWMVIAALALVGIFHSGSSTKPTTALDDTAALATRRREDEAARVAAAASAARLEEERRALAARKQRAELREDIYRALGKQPPEATGKAAPARKLPRSSPVPLDKKYIQERIREDFVPLAKDCYEALLSKNPTARGKAVFSFVIVGDAETGGIVESAELVDGTTLTDPEFSYCVSESLLSLAFAPPPNDGWVTVTYPIDFSPDEPSSKDAGAPATGTSTAPAAAAARQPRAFKAQIVDVSAWNVPPTERGRLKLLLGPPMESCYSRTSQSNPDARGVLTLLIDVDNDGEVASVDARTDQLDGKRPGRLGESFNECARRAARQVNLPSPELWKKARVGVTVHLTYSPE